MKIYVIYDTEQDEFWSAGSKVAWAAPGYAKNAWMLRYSRSPYKHFAEQERFTCREVDLDAYEDMQYRLESLEK